MRIICKAEKDFSPIVLDNLIKQNIFTLMYKKTKTPLINFQEETYLEKNPDVKDAVIRKEFSSGWAHYVLFGYYENREGGPLEIEQTIKNLLDNNNAIPYPPPHLCARVHSTDISNYNKVGKLVSFDIQSALKTIKLSLNQNSRILDFGCGCGRVISWFSYLYENCSFCGTDIDQEAISWCQQNLSNIAEFRTNNQSPPLVYPNQHFDFIYSISVFTHLPAEMQFAWLEELHRVTKNNGLLMLSIHGQNLFPDELPELKKQFLEQGFYYSDDRITDGLPEFYKTTFHTEPYIRSEWSRFFQVEGIVKKGIANLQDLVVCRRK